MASHKKHKPDVQCDLVGVVTRGNIRDALNLLACNGVCEQVDRPTEIMRMVALALA